VLCLLARLVGRAVFLHKDLRVESERLRVGAQERLDEGRAGQHPEFLVLERAQVLGADLCRPLDVCDVEVLPHPSLAQAVPDGGHGGPYSGAKP
jgi:hypothetical protein